jgi:putative FmdB family regulatory protein
MPVFDYRCEACMTTYDVYHKVREIAEDVVCPSCGSKSYKRMISLPGISVAGSVSRKQSPEQTCESGCCSGGMCGMN